MLNFLSVPTATNSSSTHACRTRVRLASFAAWLVLAVAPIAASAGNAITDINYSALPGDRVQITLTLEKPPAEPLGFTIDNPARLAFDFQDTANKLPKKSQKIGVGMARSVSAAEAQGRTRVVLNLVRLVPYETKMDGNKFQIMVQGGSPEGATTEAATFAAKPDATPSKASGSSSGGRAVTNVDFRRGEHGEGRIMISLSDPNTSVDVHREGNQLMVDLLETELPGRFARRLDVMDFATPVKTIDTQRVGDKTRIRVEPLADYEHVAYQSDQLLTIEVKPITAEEKEKKAKQEANYTGERLTLNFQNIEVRAVLQLIADFTGLNIVVSDTVGGSLTLRLKNVPWDQALDIILKTKGLDMRRTGNVILVAPAQEIADREKAELESQKQKEVLAPVRSEFVQINYAKASEIATLLKSSENNFLSTRGNVTIDERTNTLLVQDTADKLAEVRSLVATLDIPVRQVLIESRVVKATDSFSKDLGVKFGNTSAGSIGGTKLFTSGSSAGNDTMVGDAIANAGTGTTTVGTPELKDRLNVSLPSNPPAGNPGQLAVAILTKNFLLDLELSALQIEGKGEVISNPRVVTANQQEATIENGTEIPYQEASSSGATSTSFKKAVLSLTVKPQITPDDRVIMDLSVTKDSVGQTYNGIPSIDTQRVNTQVLVSNGETVVLGGVYEQTRGKDVSRVPFFGELPVVGNLFKRTTTKNGKSELLIFVTPKILKEGLLVN